MIKGNAWSNARVTEADRQLAIAELLRRGYSWRTTVKLTTRSGKKIFEATWRD